ncbi:hypothetical protein LXL04_009978 [Taraxacum kok-saghyz]
MKEVIKTDMTHKWQESSDAFDLPLLRFGISQCFKTRFFDQPGVATGSRVNWFNRRVDRPTHISSEASLNSYPTPIFVSEVLHKPSFFLCSSDELYYDQHINALDSEDQLDAAQIYFVLPNTMLGRRLSASDMAALAVKASLALDSSADSLKRNNNKARISPMVLMESTEINKNRQIGLLTLSKSEAN